jgi:hypothetical protein
MFTNITACSVQKLAPSSGTAGYNQLSGGKDVAGSAVDAATNMAMPAACGA